MKANVVVDLDIEDLSADKTYSPEEMRGIIHASFEEFCKGLLMTYDNVLIKSVAVTETVVANPD